MLQAIQPSAMILGAGAVGAVLGSRLLQAGWDVRFRVRPESLVELRRKGLRIVGPNIEMNIDGGRFQCGPLEPGAVSLVFITVKMPDFECALAELKADDDGSRLMLTVQNGLAAPELAAQLFGEDRVIAGSALVNARRLTTTRVAMQSSVMRLALAPMVASRTQAVLALCDQLEASGLEAEPAANADSLLWHKFLALEPLASACALTGMTLGELRVRRAPLRLLRALFDEVFQLAFVCGEAPASWLQRRWQAYFEGPASMRPSLATDLARGRSSELDWLTGKVVQLAARHRVAVPLHRLAYRCLLERGTFVAPRAGDASLQLQWAA